MNDEQRHVLVEKAKQLLDQATDDLDSTTLARLQQARKYAVTEREPQPKWYRRPLPLSGMVASTLAVASLVLFVTHGPTEQEMMEKHLVADLGLFTAEESLEFFEDIDFYEWLSTDEGTDSRLSLSRHDAPDPDVHGMGQGTTSGQACGRGTEPRDARVSRLI